MKKFTRLWLISMTVMLSFSFIMAQAQIETQVPTKKSIVATQNVIPAVTPADLIKEKKMEEQKAIEQKENAVINYYYGSANPDNYFKPPPTGVYENPGPTDQGGDLISTATVIPAGTVFPHAEIGTTTGFNNDYDEACTYTGSTAPDVVYSYAPTANINLNFDLCASSYDTKIYIYDDAAYPDPGNLIDCNDDFHFAAPCFVYSSYLENVPLLAGTTYYIVVDGYGTAEGAYVLDITEWEECVVECPSTLPPPILEGEPEILDNEFDVTNGGCNDDPNLFLPIACGDTYCGTSNTYLSGALNFRDTDWYLLDLSGASVNQDVTLTAEAEFALQLAIVGGDCLNQVTLASGSSASCTELAITATNLAPAQYMLVVLPSVYDGVPYSDYWASVTCTDTPEAPQGADCTDPFTVTLPAALPYTDAGQTTCGMYNDYFETCLNLYDGGEDVIYELTVTDDVTVDILLDPLGTTYTGVMISDVCPGGDPCIAFNTSSTAVAHGITGVALTVGTYYVMVDTWPAPDCIPAFDLTITVAAPPPPNDDCADAIATGEVVGLAFSTTSATYDAPGTGTCQTAPNIWYNYTATMEGNVTIDLCGSAYDTKLAVYDGLTCLGTELGCNDDDCGTQSSLTFEGVMIGDEFKIEVGGFSTNTGDGVLNIVVTNPPPNDECVNAQLITTNPETVLGTTFGATIDCAGVLDWEAVWYEVPVPYAYNNLSVDYCGTMLDIPTVGIVYYFDCLDCNAYVVADINEFVDCGDTYTNPQMVFNHIPGGPGATIMFPVYIGTEADFSVTFTVTEPIANDVMTVSIDNIGSAITPGPTNVDATVHNNGGNVETFDVELNITDGYSETQTVTGLVPGTSTTVTFTGWNAADGDVVDLTVCTTLGTDMDNSNDCVTQSGVSVTSVAWVGGAPNPVSIYLGTGQAWTTPGPADALEGYFFIMGGNDFVAAVATDRVSMYDMQADTWTTMAPLPADYVVNASAIAGDKIYHFGGSSGGVYVADCWVYDIPTDTWSAIAPLPVAMAWGKATAYMDNYIYYAGGSDGAAYFNTVYIYDIALDSWSTASPLPEGSIGASFSLAPETNLLVYVGGAGAAGLIATTRIGEIDALDPAIITWSVGTDYPGGAYYKADARPWCPGEVIIAGGNNLGGGSYWTGTNFVYKYEPATDTWTGMPPLTYAVNAHHMGTVALDNGEMRLIVADGYDSPNIINETQILEGVVCFDVHGYDFDGTSGWKIWSTYIDPVDPDIAAIFAPIEANVQIVKNGAGAFWLPGVWNGIGAYVIGEGYQVQLIAPSVLPVFGNKLVPEATPFNITDGWSIIGYLRDNPGLIDVMLNDILVANPASIIIAKDETGAFWLPGVWNGIGSQIPGRGYQIQLTLPATGFAYPAN